MKKLFKNKYLIAIYKHDGRDTLIAILDNTKEFANFFNISEHNATVTLNHFFKGQNKYFRYKGSLCEIYFIEDDEETE